MTVRRIEELDRVILTRDLAAASLRAGDIGTVVHLYNDGEAVEVEFMAADGSTIAIETLEIADVRLPNRREIPNVRALA